MLKKLLLAVLLLAPAAATAQCALCYESASQAGQKSQRALNHGVIFLLVPPVGMMLGFVGITLRIAYKRDGEGHADTDRD